MTDLDLRLLHCEKEPSEVALYDAADAYRDIDDLEMYYALKYMAENGKHPWYSGGDYSWWRPDTLTVAANVHKGFNDVLPFEFIPRSHKSYHTEFTFAGAVRWLGKRLIELGVV
jgi:hypothetical protein